MGTSSVIGSQVGAGRERTPVGSQLGAQPFVHHQLLAFRETHLGRQMRAPALGARWEQLLGVFWKHSRWEPAESTHPLGVF